MSELMSLDWILIAAGIWLVIGLVGLLSDLMFKKVNQHLFSWSLLR